MSQINDALKRARQEAPASPTSPPAKPRSKHQKQPPAPPLPPRKAGWLFPAIVIFLIVTAAFVAVWAATRQKPNQTIAAPAPVAAPVPVAKTVPAPVVEGKAAAIPAAVTPPPPLNSPSALKLQGIFYSPKSPSAIIGGITVRPGDVYLQYKVKEITATTVTLAGPNGKIIRLEMNR
jgi:hypothetical protein